MRNFSALREQVRNGTCRGMAFREMVGKHVAIDYDESGYDELDVFVNELLFVQEMPMPTRELQPEMVEYYKTPARLVFELVEKAGVTAEDVFVDVGSGLGQVVMLVNLLTGARARGIEIEPAYGDYARDCVAELGLQDVDFVTADARNADLSDGSVFFLYTPFKGGILQTVLEQLRSIPKPIRIITYGSCTEEVERQISREDIVIWSLQTK